MRLPADLPADPVHRLDLVCAGGGLEAGARAGGGRGGATGRAELREVRGGHRVIGLVGGAVPAAAVGTAIVICTAVVPTAAVAVACGVNGGGFRDAVLPGVGGGGGLGRVARLQPGLPRVNSGLVILKSIIIVHNVQLIIHFQ